MHFLLQVRIRKSDEGYFSVQTRREETVEILLRTDIPPSPAVFHSAVPPQRRTNRRYLSHFEKLGQFGHPVEEGLVDLQGFFALILLHVKVFLCG